MARISTAEACKRLILGEVVAIPTETVYGLAATLESPEAIERIFALKKRPADNPLIIHIAEASHLNVFASHIPPNTFDLVEAFWPGSLTLVLPVDCAHVPEKVRAGLTTAAFRVPNHEVSLAILRQVGPLVAPSANLSGKPSATCVEHVEEDFGDSVDVVEGGPCKAGMESTILVFDAQRWHIARLGALSAEALQEVLGYQPEVYKNDATHQPICPGHLHRHYAPKAKLMLGSNAYAKQLPIVVGFSDRRYPGAERVFSLGSSKAPDEVAHNLYEVLRQLDRHSITEAWVDMQIDDKGLWSVIRERLRRASEA